jgi:hypothetical protein
MATVFIRIFLQRTVNPMAFFPPVREARVRRQLGQVASLTD